MNALQITATDLTSALVGLARPRWQNVENIDTGEIVGKISKTRTGYEFWALGWTGEAKTEAGALRGIERFHRIARLRKERRERREAEIAAMPLHVRQAHLRMVTAFQYWQAEEHRTFIRADDRAYTKAAYLKAVEEFEAAARELAEAA